MLVGGKEFLHQLKEDEVSFAMVGRPKTVLTNTGIDVFLSECKMC